MLLRIARSHNHRSLAISLEVFGIVEDSERYPVDDGREAVVEQTVIFRLLVLHESYYGVVMAFVQAKPL